MPPALHVTPLAARRFLRRALALDEPHADIATALAHHGYVQIDPINICGRMHDLILRNRVRDYREGALHEFIHSPARPGFEHYLPGAGVLVAFPIDAWPWLSGSIATRRLRRGVYGRKLSPKGEGIAQHILGEIARRGPLTSDDIEHEGRSLTGWGTPGRLVKNILEILFVHGRVLITQRRKFRRVYDLPERVLPAAVRAQPPRTAREVAAWIVLTKLRQRRLVALKRNEIPLVADRVQRVTIDGVGGPPLFCLREDVPMLAEIQQQKAKFADSVDARLLAPLDPLIYDRRLAASLWGFDYTWEVYTPEHKRVRGYYALPLLAGTEIVGHVDPRADRAGKKLHVVSRRVRRGHASAPALRALADFLSLG